MGLKYIYESKGNLVDRIMRVMLSVIKTVKKYVAEDALHSSSRSFLCENGPGVPDNLCRAIPGRRQHEEVGVGVYLETSGDNQGYQEDSKLSH